MARDVHPYAHAWVGGVEEIQPQLPRERWSAVTAETAARLDVLLADVPVGSLGTGHSVELDMKQLLGAIVPAAWEEVQRPRRGGHGGHEKQPEARQV
jgi:hypothetical protein